MKIDPLWCHATSRFGYVVASIFPIPSVLIYSNFLHFFNRSILPFLIKIVCDRADTEMFKKIFRTSVINGWSTSEKSACRALTKTKTKRKRKRNKTGKEIKTKQNH